MGQETFGDGMPFAKFEFDGIRQTEDWWADEGLMFIQRWTRAWRDSGDVIQAIRISALAGDYPRRPAANCDDIYTRTPHHTPHTTPPPPQ